MLETTTIVGSKRSATGVIHIRSSVAKYYTLCGNLTQRGPRRGEAVEDVTKATCPKCLAAYSRLRS